MTTVDPLAPLTLDGWDFTQFDPYQHRLQTGDVVLLLRRSARSELAGAYPVGGADLLLTPQAGGPPALGAALTDLVPALWRADPKARRVLVAVPAGDEHLTGALTGAGLIRAVDVDDASGRALTLFVAEPEHVRAQSAEIDDMPV